MVTCDYLILGSGFAGIGLKYKLLGKTILIDKNPFQYKIGESHVPNLINDDQGLFSLIPKITRMKSYTRKKGTIFCDSYHGKNATSFSTPLGDVFALHCEREEIEKLLVNELSVEIRKESIVDIDLSNNIVITNKNSYHFTKYILDCSGPAMVIANKLNLVSPVGQFDGMKAQWSYWTIDQLNNDVDSWADWTVINKIGPDSWIWQIPIYQSSILSMGLLHRGTPFSNEDFIKYVKRYSAACYQLTSIVQNPDRAIKPYMKEVHARFHYSKRSKKCAGKNWILVGDACCFADPVYSTGSGVAMLEAITIANNLNKNEGKFDHVWYEKKCNALLNTVIDGIGTWYSGDAFDKKVNQRINRTILQGGFSRHFKPSQVTEGAKQVQEDIVSPFYPALDQFSRTNLWAEFKVYYIDSSVVVRNKGVWDIVNQSKPIRIINKAVQKVFEKHIIERKLSFQDLFLIVELNLRTSKDRAYFWKVIQCIELIGSSGTSVDRIYYFHPELYKTENGQLKLGGRRHYLIVEEIIEIEFFEELKGKIFFGKELLALVKKGPKRSARTQQSVKKFIKKFRSLNTFGRNFYFTG